MSPSVTETGVFIDNKSLILISLSSEVSSEHILGEVGSDEGLIDGVTVGNCDGFFDGDRDGLAVEGNGEGFTDGANEGECVGARVGENEGLNE
mmetsp:Transcript_39691/g.59653  ORF Transcript_39691/g.59653 Transcript_39691/m.59653 type:complete len:93 (-) Transcript_39691:444-722(-)